MKEYINLVEYKNWTGLEFSDSGDKELFWNKFYIV